jgi:NodT family efflux transporter outer membrane factor (OMF) lipoprotein
MASTFHRKTALRAWLGLALSLATGCAVGPDYATPEPETPDQWHVELSSGLAEGRADLQTWWTLLGDPVLDGLIERARADGYDLQQAAARVRQARSGLGIAKGARVPEVEGVGAAQRRRPSDDTIPGARAKSDDFFQLGVDASWELDFWGRIRRAVESAQADYQASVEDYRDTLVVIFAEVATTYIDVRTFQERLRYARGNVDLQRQSLALTQDRRSAGLVGDLDVRQAELNLARTESLIPRLEEGLAFSVHRLAVLSGRLPSSIYAELGEEHPIPSPPEGVGVGLPADLLRQRPDIRRAERLLAGRTARIGVATADLYPRFSLSGSFTVDATRVSNLFDWNSRAFGIGPTLQWNLFAGGRVRAAIEGEEANTEEALGFYEQTVLEAYEEAENALVSYMREGERRDALARSVAAAREGVRLVNVVYRQGLTEFQNVLDTEQFLFEQEDELAQSQGRVVRNLVRVYKALGGGWAP